MSPPPSNEAYIHQDGFPARLRHAAERFGGASALAKAIGRSEGAVRKWIRGDSEPNVSDLCAICRISGTNVAWLATGEHSRPEGTEGVREDPAIYRVARAQELDDDLLESALCAVDEESAARGGPLPLAKRSAAVVALYGLSRIAGSVDRKAASRLVKLAV